MFAQGCRILVNSKSWSVGGELEEYPARFEEINRLEPEPVDHFGWAASRALDSVAYP
jgi:hypothetical protein